MTRTSVDHITYATLLLDTVASYLDQGMDLRAARQLAKSDMERTFVVADNQAEYQRDKDDERMGDWTR